MYMNVYDVYVWNLMVICKDLTIINIWLSTFCTVSVVKVSGIEETFKTLKIRIMLKYYSFFSKIFSVFSLSTSNIF